ncbi:uncharacterized protein LOC143544769 [Bidens hawaiensis]|uniref:uncharacterized protein LOC143544769 n=1 Tax=Bidens hawaiensis TaxID=980011 RepID=UPI00404A3C7D
MGNTCTKAREFFGVIQRIYSVFANSTKRWAILKDNVKGLTLKSMCPTRWESRVDSVKPIRFQLIDVREALLEVRDLNTDTDTKTQSDARSLSKNEACEFVLYLATVIWYEILSTVNFVSKRLQSKNMILDVAIKQVKILIKFFKNYREVGFSKAIDEATKIAIEMGVDPVFSQKRPIIRKKQFDESHEQEVLFSPEENFKVNYFLCIVDQAIASLETRFKQYEQYEKLSGFLFPKN